MKVMKKHSKFSLARLELRDLSLNILLKLRKMLENSPKSMAQAQPGMPYPEYKERKYTLTITV